MCCLVVDEAGAELSYRRKYEIKIGVVSKQVR